METTSKITPQMLERYRGNLELAKEYLSTAKLDLYGVGTSKDRDFEFLTRLINYIDIRLGANGKCVSSDAKHPYLRLPETKKYNDVYMGSDALCGFVGDLVEFVYMMADRIGEAIYWLEWFEDDDKSITKSAARSICENGLTLRMTIPLLDAWLARHEGRVAKNPFALMRDAHWHVSKENDPQGGKIEDRKELAKTLMATASKCEFLFPLHDAVLALNGFFTCYGVGGDFRDVTDTFEIVYNTVTDFNTSIIAVCDALTDDDGDDAPARG